MFRVINTDVNDERSTIRTYVQSTQPSVMSAAEAADGTLATADIPTICLQQPPGFKVDFTGITDRAYKRDASFLEGAYTKQPIYDGLINVAGSRDRKMLSSGPVVPVTTAMMHERIMGRLQLGNQPSTQRDLVNRLAGGNMSINQGGRAKVLADPRFSVLKKIKSDVDNVSHKQLRDALGMSNDRNIYAAASRNNVTISVHTNVIRDMLESIAEIELARKRFTVAVESSLLHLCYGEYWPGVVSDMIGPLPTRGGSQQTNSLTLPNKSIMFGEPIAGRKGTLDLQGELFIPRNGVIDYGPLKRGAALMNMVFDQAALFNALQDDPLNMNELRAIVSIILGEMGKYDNGEGFGSVGDINLDDPTGYMSMMVSVFASSYVDFDFWSLGEYEMEVWMVLATLMYAYISAGRSIPLYKGTIRYSKTHGRMNLISGAFRRSLRSDIVMAEGEGADDIYLMPATVSRRRVNRVYSCMMRDQDLVSGGGSFDPFGETKIQGGVIRAVPSLFAGRNDPEVLGNSQVVAYENGRTASDLSETETLYRTVPQVIREGQTDEVVRAFSMGPMRVQRLMIPRPEMDGLVGSKARMNTRGFFSMFISDSGNVPARGWQVSSKLYERVVVSNSPNKAGSISETQVSEGVDVFDGDRKAYTSPSGEKISSSPEIVNTTARPKDFGGV